MKIRLHEKFTSKIFYRRKYPDLRYIAPKYLSLSLIHTSLSISWYLWLFLLWSPLVKIDHHLFKCKRMSISIILFYLSDICHSPLKYQCWYICVLGFTWVHMRSSFSRWLTASGWGIYIHCMCAFHQLLDSYIIKVIFISRIPSSSKSCTNFCVWVLHWALF